MNLSQPGVIDKTIPFPSEWNDLTLRQLHLVSNFIMSEFRDKGQARAALFLSLLQSVCGKKVKNIVNRLDPEDAVINGLPATEFIIKENNLTRQPYPTLELPFSWKSLTQTVYGPADDFNDITCGEFEDAEIFFNQFKIEPGAESLANLAAVLYRAKGVKYLRRHRWNGTWISYQSEKLLPRFKKLTALQLYTIYLWYCGCREQLPKYFPECFDGAPAANEEPDMMVFTNCIHHAAGAKNGSRNDIRMTPLKEFFQELKLQKIENDRQIAEMEKHG